MKIQIIQGMVHSAGDLVKGAVHTVGVHPDEKLGKWLVATGRAVEVDDKAKPAPAKNADK